MKDRPLVRSRGRACDLWVGRSPRVQVGPLSPLLGRPLDRCPSQRATVVFMLRGGYEATGGRIFNINYMATKNDQKVMDPASVPGLRIWNSTLNISSNSEDVCITTSSLLRSQSPLAFLEVQSSGTPPLTICQQAQASSEVQSFGSQDSISTFQATPDSQGNKLAESPKSLKASDIAKSVQQVTDSKSEPSSWKPGSIHSRKTRNNKQKKRVNSLYFPILILNGKMRYTLHFLF